MKISLKLVKNLANQVPGLLSKGQQALNDVNASLDIVKSSNIINKSLQDKMTNTLAKGQETLNTVSTITDAVKTSGNTTIHQKEETMPKPTHNKSCDAVNTKEISSGNIDLASTVAGLGSPTSVVSTIQNMIQQANDTIRYCQEQETLRTEIKANAAIEISKINAMADMVRDYLNRSFDERAALFDNYFSVLDKALTQGNNTVVAQTLQSINSLAASSPFKDLADINKVTTTLSEGGEWDI